MKTQGQHTETEVGHLCQSQISLRGEVETPRPGDSGVELLTSVGSDQVAWTLRVCDSMTLNIVNELI